VGIPPRSQRDFGHQDFYSQWDPGKILAGTQNSWWPKSHRDPGANLTKILAGKQKSQRPKSRRDPTMNPAKKTGHHGGIPAKARKFGGIPVPILQG